MFHFLLFMSFTEDKAASPKNLVASYGGLIDSGAGVAITVKDTEVITPIDVAEIEDSQVQLVDDIPPNDNKDDTIAALGQLPSEDVLVTSQGEGGEPDCCQNEAEEATLFESESAMNYTKDEDSGSDTSDMELSSDDDEQAPVKEVRDPDLEDEESGPLRTKNEVLQPLIEPVTEAIPDGPLISIGTVVSIVDTTVTQFNPDCYYIRLYR
jgi:hypothetical protein